MKDPGHFAAAVAAYITFVLFVYVDDDDFEPELFYLTSHDDFFDSQMKVLFFAPSEV